MLKRCSYSMDDKSHIEVVTFMHTLTGSNKVLQLVAQGLSANEIAKTLFLSGGTVRNYMSEILQKLEAKNRIDAIGIAEKNGWLN